MYRSGPDQLCEGPRLTGFHIWHNDTHHHLQINGRVLTLSPTEYRLCIHLLRHFERLELFALLRQQQPDLSMPNVFVSFEELQDAAGLAERSHVGKHLSNAKSKLKVHGISIICVHGCGYTLSLTRQTEVG